MNKLLLILGILNIITGCVAGIMLVELTGNQIYFIINIITGATSGACFANLGLGEQ